MKKIYCDRCGDEIYRKNAIRLNIVDQDKNLHKVYDICDECFDHFMKYDFDPDERDQRHNEKEKSRRMAWAISNY